MRDGGSAFLGLVVAARGFRDEEYASADGLGGIGERREYQDRHGEPALLQPAKRICEFQRVPSALEKVRRACVRSHGP